jgi:hypothetical protein
VTILVIQNEEPFNSGPFNSGPYICCSNLATCKFALVPFRVLEYRYVQRQAILATVGVVDLEQLTGTQNMVDVMNAELRLQNKQQDRAIISDAKCGEV